VRTRHGEFERAIHEERPQDIERDARMQIQQLRAFPGQATRGFVSGCERPHVRIF
jgi:hypothetical protein